MYTFQQNTLPYNVVNLVISINNMNNEHYAIQSLQHAH